MSTLRGRPTRPRTKFSGDETNAEDYLYLKPDLVIFAYPSGTIIQQLQKLKIPVLLLPAATTIANVDSQLAELGTATGHLSGAENVESSFAADIASAVRSAGGHGRGATYYIELDPTNYYTATSGTFIGAEFSLFGMRDIADSAGHGSQYPQISPEYILKERPRLCVLGRHRLLRRKRQDLRPPARLQRAQGGPPPSRHRGERLGRLAMGPSHDGSFREPVGTSAPPRRSS